MKQYDPLWSEINTLLAHLEGFDAVKLVREHFAQYNNPAPPLLLTKSIEKLQKRLDEANETGHG